MQRWVRDSARAEGGVSPAGYGALVGPILAVFRLRRGARTDPGA